MPRKTPRHLAPASGRQDHTALPSATSAIVKGAIASIASRPNVRDVRTPLLRAGTAAVLVLICPTAPAKYFCRWGWTGGVGKLPDGQIRLRSFAELSHIVLLTTAHSGRKAMSVHYPRLLFCSANLFRRAIPFCTFQRKASKRLRVWCAIQLAMELAF